jgi:hypothetical protein
VLRKTTCWITCSTSSPAGPRSDGDQRQDLAAADIVYCATAAVACSRYA